MDQVIESRFRCSPLVQIDGSFLSRQEMMNRSAQGMVLFKVTRAKFTLQ